MAAYQPIRGNGPGLQFLNFQFGDTTHTKVFVGGLAWETQSETLHGYFDQFGDILEAVVITDKHTGRSKGYGFVTFNDAEAAKRACADPTPVIDGRRANCNLASLGRAQPSLTYGRVCLNLRHLRPAGQYFWSSQNPGGSFVGSSSYRQPVPYGYQQYPYYGYPAYGPEYVFPQVPYNPYAGQHHPQMLGLPGLVNPNAFSYGQMGPPPPGSPGYRAIQGMVTPGPNVLPYGRPNVSGATTDIIPMPPTPYLTGVAPPSFGQARSIVPAHPSSFSRSAGHEKSWTRVKSSQLSEVGTLKPGVRG
ncbi:Nucleotide-binding, alpha-beta plait [Cynara cardunculus var. scolymus]|uniref:Nucleotide-binding, alpha-beta plait n=1 Tax=Cynara cardunculus var. scolymus TaxID=59895 RepID=A0A118JUW7_CYNCS|nr:Nucleotide-binding, alpha-beta plait [Cynara cardunculus var. scolymus]